MSCLLSSAKQDILRNKIANNIFNRAKEGKSLDLNEYVREIYTFIKDASGSDLTALDAARLVPTLLQQITSLKPSILEAIEKTNPDIEFEIVKLKKEFNKDIEAVRDLLGIKESPAPLLKAVQEQVEKIKEVLPEVEASSIEYNDFPNNPFMTYGPEVKNFTDRTKPDYLQPTESEVFNYTVQKEIGKGFREQVNTNNINNSSEMKFPGVSGGIYTRVTSDKKGYNGLILTLVDKAGTPIKFNTSGEVDAEGKIPVYKVATQPLVNTKGEVITNKEEFDKEIKKPENSGLKISAPQVFKNIQKQINYIVDRNNPGGKKLTAEEKEKAFKEASIEVANNYKTYLQMNKYLNNNPGSFITGVLNGSDPGFVDQNVWKRTPLSKIGLSDQISINLETQEQPAGSNFKEGIVYFSYPGVDKPLVAVASNFIEKSELLNTIISLFTSELYNTSNQALSPADRMNLIEQFISPSIQGIKFLSNEVGGGGRNWTDSKGRYDVQVGDKSYKIKYDNSPESLTYQKTLDEAIRKKLTTGYVEYDDKGFPKDKSYNSKSRVEEAVKQGATLIYDLEKTVPNSIYAKPKSEGRHGTEYDYFKVYFPTLNAKNSLISDKYDNITFGKDGIITTQKKPYNDYIKDNFSTSAVPSPDGIIRQINPFFAFQPVISELSKFTPKAKVTEINNDYKGKIIFITHNSGKSTLASQNPDVLDADTLTFAEWVKQFPEDKYPEFIPDPKLTDAENLFEFNYIASKIGVNPVTVYDTVGKQMQELTKQGKTILTGSSKLMKYADIVLSQDNPKINSEQYVRRGGTNKERKLAGELNKPVIPINDYVVNVLQKPLSELKKENSIKVEKPVEQVQKTPADNTSKSILSAIKDRNKFLEKNLLQKSIEEKATEEQIKQAETWYNNHPLSTYFPFSTVFSAININKPGPVAQWAVHGINLFEYYSPDGKTKIVSGDTTDLYHESWHGFTQTFLTKEEKEKLYSEVRKTTGTFKDYNGRTIHFKYASNLQLEEFLAEDFRKYMLSGGKTRTTSTRNNIFRRFLNFLKRLFTGVKIREIYDNPLSNPTIHDLYDKLKVGDLSGYNFSIDNVEFGVLNHNVVARHEDNPVRELGVEDSTLLVNTMDSVLSTIINTFNQEETDNQGFGVHSYTTQLMRSKENRKVVYGLIKENFQNEILPKLITKVEQSSNDFQKTLAQQDVDLMNWAISEFGNVEDLAANRDKKGLIAYHWQKSKYLSTEDKEAFFDDDIDEDKQNEKAKDNAFDRAGNENSQLDLAAPEVHYLLRSIHKWDEKRQPVINRLGVQELTDYHEVWNKLARVLGGTLKMSDMYNKLVKASSDKGVITDPVIHELLSKLGPSEAKQTSSMNLWIKFWQNFNLAVIPLVQMNIKRKLTEDGTELDDYDVTIGSSNTVSRKVGNLWRQAFQNDISSLVSSSIKRNKDTSDIEHFNQNYLDLKDIIYRFEDVSGKLKANSNFDFFRAIGILLSDKPEIRKAVDEGTGYAAGIFSRIKRIVNERNINRLYSLDEVFGREFPKTDELQPIVNENPNYTRLKELESKNSDYAKNSMVTNAEGNTQFEQSLHNTISILISSINEVESYAELISLPYMNHLDININPFVKASKILNSIFDLDNYEPGSSIRTGKKRLDSAKVNADVVKLNMTNLSGVQLINETGSEGISSASADEFTKMILDFHLSTIANKPELMRHADKGTSFSVWASKIVNGSKDGKTYVSTLDLIPGKGMEASYTKVIETLTPYINAELERINKLKEMSKQEDFVYDINYLNKGQEFVIFEDVLYPELQNRLLNYKNLEEAVNSEPDIQSAINSAIISYFEHQSDQVNKRMGEAEFISQKLIDDNFLAVNRLGKSNKPISKQQVKEGLVRSFVVNSWIHNLETMSLIYGDIAQYNHIKEEFHKRNAGAGSTGSLFNTDQYTLNWVSNKGRLYAKSLGLQEKRLSLDGSYNSIILEDNEIPSSYIKLLEEKLGEKVAKEYMKMNEGDAQGGITFDFYRAIRMLEGKWLDEHEVMYKDIVAGREVDPVTATNFFPTVKFQYWGPVKTEEGQLPLNAFHKFSLFPMIPSVIKGTNLEKLHHDMIRQGADYWVFKSGSKISNLTKIVNNKAIQDKFYSDKENHVYKEGQEFTMNTVFLQFLKDQLEIAPYYKNTVTFSTQMRKLIENGLMEGGVPVDYQKDKPLLKKISLWNNLSEEEKLSVSPYYTRVKEYEKDISDLTEKRKEELKKEANIKYDDDGNIIFNDKFKQFIINELNRSGELGEHELDFIKVGKDGKIAHDFSISLSAEKLEKILNAIVVRRLVRQKFNGEGLIQVSGAGFESILRGELTDEEKNKYGTNGLAFYTLGIDGKTQAMKVKIALQGDFKNLLYLIHNDGEVIGTRERLNEMLKNDTWLGTDNHRKMITIIGPRIPVQGLNSMEFAEVYEFLPIEAGNIVVLPSEIVAKSGGDFDIDKLTFMYPNISSGVNYEFWKSIKGISKLEQLQEEHPELDLSESNINYVIENRKSEDLTSEDKAVLDVLIKGSVRHVKYIEDKSAEGLENSILNKMKEILEMPENYESLVTPNSTDIAKPIADSLSKDVMDFDPKSRTQTGYQERYDRLLSNNKRSPEEEEELKYLKAKLSRIPGTKVFEILYNLYKHSSNNIGKQSLGILAKINTYNTLFNRVGMHLNHSYIEKGITKRLNILLPHNHLTDKDGKDVISLAHLLDTEDNYKIADIISQLINGSVDVAKDAWLFNLQGNREIIPTLSFMIMAGVPIKQAVYMVSNPLIRAYVKEQKLAKSTFAGPLGKSPGNPLFFRVQARNNILTNPKYGINLSEDETNSKGIYNYIINITDKEKDFFNSKDIENNLKSRITAKDYTDIDRAIFAHFLEIEDMSKPITAIVNKTDVDTKGSKNLFDAQGKLEGIEELKYNKIIPEEIITKLVGNPLMKMKGESPIYSFNVQDFQISLFKDLFPLRNNKVLNDFILNLLKTESFNKERESTGWETEKFVTQLRNDLVPFIFQNYLHQFNLENIRVYNGVELDTAHLVETIPSLKRAVYVQNTDGVRKFFIDKLQLRKDFQELSSKKPGVAPVSPVAFPNENSYYTFVFERELLRSMYPGKEGWNNLQERLDVQSRLSQAISDNVKLVNETDDQFKARIDNQVYEETLRDMALDNTLNIWKLFKSRESMADQLVQIQVAYPELFSKYSLVQNLATSIADNTGGGNRVANIILTDMMKDADKINLFHQNLMELSNPARIQINTNSVIERQRVSTFFEKLSVFAFLQSGLNTDGQLSLVRIVPQERFTRMMQDFESKFLPQINPVTLQKFYNKFLEITSQRRLRSRFRDYTINNFSPVNDKVLYIKNIDKENPDSIVTLSGMSSRDTELKTDNSGNFLYQGQDLKISTAKELVASHPSILFVFNGATESTTGQTGEAALTEAKLETGNVLGFPSRRNYSKDNSNQIKDIDNFIDPKIKELVDNTIQSIKDYKANGMSIAFPEQGIGQYMIEGSRPAPETFNYLSQRLFEEFKYVNPNFEDELYNSNKENLVQKGQVITDEDIQDNFERESRLDNTDNSTSEKAATNLFSFLGGKFNLKGEVINDPNEKWKGKLQDNQIPVINLAYANLSDGFHEYAHPLLMVLRRENYQQFLNLYNDLTQSPEWKDISTLAHKKISDKYKDLKFEDAIEEVLATAIGYAASNKFNTLSSKFQRFIDKLLKWINKYFGTKYAQDINVNPITMNSTFKEVVDYMTNPQVKFNLPKGWEETYSILTDQELKKELAKENEPGDYFENFIDPRSDHEIQLEQVENIEERRRRELEFQELTAKLKLEEENNKKLTEELEKLSPESEWKKKFDSTEKLTHEEEQIFNLREIIRNFRRLETSIEIPYELSSYLKLPKADYKPREGNSTKLKLFPNEGTNIPITSKFLEYLKKNPTGSTFLNKPFKLDSLTDYEKEVLEKYRKELVDEVTAWANTNKKPVPDKIQNTRLLPKLQEWIESKYSMEQYDTPKQVNTYGITGALTNVGRAIENKGGYEVVISNGFLATKGHTYKLLDKKSKPALSSKIKGSKLTIENQFNGLGWYIYYKIGDKTLLYEYQSDFTDGDNSILSEANKNMEHKVSAFQKVVNEKLMLNSSLVELTARVNRRKVDLIKREKDIQDAKDLLKNIQEHPDTFSKLSDWLLLFSPKQLTTIKSMLKWKNADEKLKNFMGEDVYNMFLTKTISNDNMVDIDWDYFSAASKPTRQISIGKDGHINNDPRIIKSIQDVITITSSSTIQSLILKQREASRQLFMATKQLERKQKISGNPKFEEYLKTWQQAMESRIRLYQYQTQSENVLARIQNDINKLNSSWFMKSLVTSLNYAKTKGDNIVYLPTAQLMQEMGDATTPYVTPYDLENQEPVNYVNSIEDVPSHFYDLNMTNYNEVTNRIKEHLLDKIEKEKEVSVKEEGPSIYDDKQQYMINKKVATLSQVKELLNSNILLYNSNIYEVSGLPTSSGATNFLNLSTPEEVIRIYNNVLENNTKRWKGLGGVYLALRKLKNITFEITSVPEFNAPVIKVDISNFNTVMERFSKLDSPIVKQLKNSGYITQTHGDLFIKKHFYSQAINLIGSINKDNPGLIKVEPAKSKLGAEGQQIFKVTIDPQLEMNFNKPVQETPATYQGKVKELINSLLSGVYNVSLAEKGYDVRDYIDNLVSAKTLQEVRAIQKELMDKLC